MAKVLLITGGGRGIGAATARLAAAAGYDVAVNFLRDESTANKLAGELSNKHGKAIALQGDVANESDVVRMFEELDRRLGRLTALVNNAGIVDRGMRVEQMSAERLQRMFAVNVSGSFLCAREAIRRMSRRHGGEGGVIVNVSSIAARLGGPGEYVDYAASKGALDTFTIGLAKEVGADGIRVNAVRPGIIRTEIHLASGDPGRVERIGAAAPLGRAGEAEEVGQAILWLLSEEASYASGAILDVGGGR
jgi:NAD(P)-dependent dehydrogenase (short-subunit alcohol dehydrogenase family)